MFLTSIERNVALLKEALAKGKSIGYKVEISKQIISWLRDYMATNISKLSLKLKKSKLPLLIEFISLHMTVKRLEIFERKTQSNVMLYNPYKYN